MEENQDWIVSHPAEAAEAGVEWCTMQAKDLVAHGVPSIHFYSLMATQSVKRVAQAVY